MFSDTLTADDFHACYHLGYCNAWASKAGRTGGRVPPVKKSAGDAPPQIEDIS